MAPGPQIHSRGKRTLLELVYYLASRAKEYYCIVVLLYYCITVVLYYCISVLLH